MYHVHRGAIIYVACTDGKIQKGDRITSYFTKKSYEVQEVGIARPNFVPTNTLYVFYFCTFMKSVYEIFLTQFNERHSGQVGYMICNMRSIKEAFVGDTIFLEKSQVKPFEGKIEYFFLLNL